jgi:hypothetical protein
MIAAHSAAMECYRRAMLKDQTFAGRGLTAPREDARFPGRSDAPLSGGLDGAGTVQRRQAHHAGGTMCSAAPCLLRPSRQKPFGRFLNARDGAADGAAR